MGGGRHMSTDHRVVDICGAVVGIQVNQEALSKKKVNQEAAANRLP
jgi:hypothetical protein